MGSSNLLHKIAGWLVFAIALTVYYFSAERTGSLWDCGEFILGAYKLQVVHPPGAPFFVLVGRLFTWVATLVSDNPENIAFSVNLMSGICTALTAALVCWITIMLGCLALAGRRNELQSGQDIALAGAGIVAGLATAFSTSIWFSAVEGEVYAMSTFFTALTLWSTVKWYSLPNNPQHDRWLLLTVYVAGLSIGVHLLSLLTFPALALFYYFKKYKNHTFWGMAAAAAVGVLLIVATQKLIIVGIPLLWSRMELIMVNGLGLPFHSGLIPTLLIVAGVIAGLLRYAHITQNSAIQNLTTGAALLAISFSIIGVVVIRANTNPPVNMNAPTDAMRLIPYINREQYGERALLRGPNFNAEPIDTKIEDRYGRVGDKYEYTDYKITLEYEDSDKILLPRMGDNTQNRPDSYKQWMGLNPEAALPPGRPSGLDNMSYMMRYQIGWMYWRYFMWNFAGRQNGDQGFAPWDKSSGHWITGIKAFDAMRLGNQSELPKVAEENPARNKYYGLPFLFGIIGLLFHFRRRSEDAMAILGMFIITGIGIIIYSNQPPNEPRERDYVLVGSFFTFCIWIGMAVLAIAEFARTRLQGSGPVMAVLASVLVLTAPVLMGFENFDDHSRRLHKGSRDYASNFLNSCEENAIIFTYGDNDTYPLWYAQEVEGIRTDVRVVNLSLIAVDWYIDLLRRKVNNSAPIKMTIPSDAYRGRKRNQVFYYNPGGADQQMSLKSALQFVGEDHPLSAGRGRTLESYLPSKNLFLPVDRQQAIAAGLITEQDSIVDRIPLRIDGEQLIKDDLAVLDIIASNLWERPIYFAVTCRDDKMFGMNDFMQLEGLGLRITPKRGVTDPQYGMIGNGSVAADKVYENVMTKFKWGNFDKYKLYVDKSYLPSVQSIQLSMRRTAFELLREGKKDDAIKLIDKYFEVYPNMNFPYDYRAMYMLAVYFQAEAYDKAKPHLEILAANTQDLLEYLDSLDSDTLKSYEQDYRLAYQTMENILTEARRAKDDDFVKKLEEMFGPHLLEDTAPEMPDSLRN
jgi:tetratricopeptide (TPR) repeat protein